MGVIIVPSAGKLGNPHELSKHLTNAWHAVNAQKLSVIVWDEIQRYLFSSLERLTPYRLSSPKNSYIFEGLLELLDGR